MKRASFVLAQGDRLPELVLTALGSAGLKQNLSAATGIVAHLYNLSSGIAITPQVAITNAASGEITITLGATDTLVPGLYRLWVVVTFPGGNMTFPSCPDGEDEILIEICPA
jgi:hypothetical protein